MIGDLVINVIVWFVNSLISFLPASNGWDDSVFSAFSAMGGYRAIFDPIIPWATLAATVTIVFGTEIAIFGFKTFKWVVSHIPFIGGKGI